MYEEIYVLMLLHAVSVVGACVHLLSTALQSEAHMRALLKRFHKSEIVESWHIIVFCTHCWGECDLHIFEKLYVSAWGVQGET